jgi:carbonic anhydrase
MAPPSAPPPTPSSPPAPTAEANPLGDLLRQNRAWAQQIEKRTPGFFTRLLQQQTPQYLWVHSDLNALSVMQYAIDQLRVRHVMVVGHYGCGGVTAALHNRRIGLADNWLRHVQDVRNKHRVFLDALPSDEAKLRALCELNVLEQSLNVCETTVVQDAWAREQSVVVHGWVYGLHNGLLEDLCMTVSHAGDVDAAYQAALAKLMARHVAETAAAFAG